MSSLRWQQAPPGELPAGFRTQPVVPHNLIYRTWRRMMTRRAYVRDAPGQGFLIERSIFQPVSIPAKVQVDLNLEYTHSNAVMPGAVGYLERRPYTQGGTGRSRMTAAAPQYVYTVQAPRFSTLPTILGVGLAQTAQGAQ